jgi:hypothetical protein
MLMAVSLQLQLQVVRMQKALARVWHRFAYTSHPKLRSEIWGAHTGKLDPLLQEEDAFGTIMQWLYGRIDAVTAARERVAGKKSGSKGGHSGDSTSSDGHDYR